MNKLISLLASALLALACLTPAAASDATHPLDPFDKSRADNMASVQNGAKLFANYCLNCHAAAFMRYTRLTDLGLSELQVKQNLMFPTDKMSETMKVALDAKQGKEWFGATPPDLTLIARAKGGDYLYTYLRTFYRDDTRPTGWNNLVFPNVGMPHVLWELQGQRAAVYAEKPDPHDPKKVVHSFERFSQITPGTMSATDYDHAVADLVAYLQWMGEPAQAQRVRIGVGVIIFLLIFTVIAWRLNAAYWKDVS